MKRPHGFDNKTDDARKRPRVDAPVSSAGEVSAEDVPAQPVDIRPPHPLDQSAEQAVETTDELAESAERTRQAREALRQARTQRKRRERWERKRFTRFSRERSRRWFVALGSVLALAVFIVVGIFSPALSLRTITVSGVDRLDSQVVVQSLSEQVGKPLAFLDGDAIEAALREFPLIQEYSVETLPPHELVIRVIERRPVLNLKRGEAFDLVDPAGVVIESAATRIPGYPLGDALVSDVKSPAFAAAAESLAYMQPELAAQVDVAAATTDQDVTFKLASGLTIVWGSAEDSLKKSVLVNTMLTALNGRPISVIDVSSTEAPVFS